VRRLLGRIAIACALIGAAAPAGAGAAAKPAPPAPLSADNSPADINSTYGSGSFGSWGVDAFGLPFYRYDVDEATNPMAKQPELAGGTQAQHQLGNDHIKGMAFNDGYTQFWSQDRLPQWANLYQPASNHFAGGYGYLNVAGQAYSLMYLDRPKSSPDFVRSFGVGYYRRDTVAGGIDVSDVVYAPFGNDPVLLHDVTLKNTTSTPLPVSYFEYWDVNPYYQSLGFQRNIGMNAPTYDAKTNTLAVAQTGTQEADTNPLSIFAASLQGPVADWDTSVKAFFGAGSRAAPQEVTTNHLSDTLTSSTPDGQAGDVLFAFRAPTTLQPGQSVTLRYVYGMAHPDQIAPLVAKYRAALDPFTASERAWFAYLPRASFGRAYTWVVRELQWDAYLLRSATVFEEVCGYHTITQGGYYQYSDGYNLGYRSWLHYILPMIYSDPELAREILEYSVSLQPTPPAAQNPYGMGPLCQRVDLGTSDDLDFWLLLGASAYGLGTRDTHFFDTEIPYFDTQGQDKATIWEHLKVAFQHEQSMLGPHGGYIAGSTGDWNDFSTEFEQLTESMLVTAQNAYALPQLAELADMRRDRAFATQLRAAGAKDLATMRAQWTGGGWYSRGYSGNTQVGSGVIFEEPQPWAILAGAPSLPQANTLSNNIERYLDGVGAPAGIGAPAKFGSAQVPAQADPGVTEKGPLPHNGPLPDVFNQLTPNSPLQGADEWPGGVWFDLNGWLTWAYSTLEGVVPSARQLAWSEYTRNTLANHATLWPTHWDGTISVDDVCYAYYSQHPSYCGNGLGTSYEGEITEQPTWMVMNAINLAGVAATETGFDVTPHLPMSTFNVRFPEIGVAQRPGLIRGYFRPVQGGTLVIQVAPPPQSYINKLYAYVNGHLVPHSLANGLVVFELPTTAGRAANWAVAATRNVVTLGCSPPTGTLTGAQLGPFELGLSRRRARHTIEPFSITHYGFDNFCLRSGWGIRLGYGSRALLSRYPAALRLRYINHVVLALTANRYYALDGVRPGAQVANIAGHLHLGRPFHVGLNYWYIAPGTAAHGVLKVRHGVVQEVGIAAEALTKTRAADWRLLKSFAAV
jgi:hypothetical protein